MYVIVVGNPLDGIDLVGPFDNGELAMDHATLFFRRGEWWLMELTAPETDEEKKG